ncbi:hypothetical protein [Fluviibacterium sp. S390]|uniref:hypothetical protein n=1 Tax=Fluviibacterium sp. S390 TaxID=3415139 RepID=UPI003C7D173D
MRSYETARSLFSFLGFCSWVVIVIGAGAAFMGGAAVGATSFNNTPNIMQIALAAAPGVAILLLGLFGLALVQMGRAGVDSAEYGQQMLSVARNQLDISQQMLAQGATMAASYTEIAHQRSQPSPVSGNTAAPPASFADMPGSAALADADPDEPALTPMPARPEIPHTHVQELGDGHFKVHDRTFSNETDARDYQQKLLVK